MGFNSGFKGLKLALEMNNRFQAPAPLPPWKETYQLPSMLTEHIWISGCEERKFLVPVWKFTLMCHSSSYRNNDYQILGKKSGLFFQCLAGNEVSET